MDVCVPAVGGAHPVGVRECRMLLLGRESLRESICERVCQRETERVWGVLCL